MEKKKQFLLNAAYGVMIAGFAFVILRWGIGLLAPFLIGLLIAELLEPGVSFFVSRFGMKRKPIGILLLLIFYGTVGMLLVILGVRLTVAGGALITRLPDLYAEEVEPLLDRLFSLLKEVTGFLDRRNESSFGNMLSGLFSSFQISLGGAVSELSVKALGILSGIATQVPEFVVRTFLVIISSFFFLLDRERYRRLILNLLPEKKRALAVSVKEQAGKTVGRYLRSYSVILSITFGELAVGLLLVGIKNAIPIALGIALFDILPVFGSGGILIPWGIFLLIGRDFRRGIGLIILSVIISIVRNIIEPKIVGKQVGLPPLVTLIAMFVGTKLFGFIGLFLLPILISVAVSFRRELHSEKGSSLSE